VVPRALEILADFGLEGTAHGDAWAACRGTGRAGSSSSTR
jgi:hypothetical protein